MPEPRTLALTPPKVRSAVAALAAAALIALFALAPGARADSVICPPGSGAGQCKSPGGIAVDFESGRVFVADSGNNRIDVFDSSGSFEFAFGWGVADGGAELQSCTSTCLKGLRGGGAGEFGQLSDIAVDNDPASPSQHDLYVVDRGQDFGEGFAFESGVGARVQKFSPTGEFLLAFGGGVIGGGAAGSGDLSSGSTTVSAVKTTKKTFEAGQTITGVGIAANTKIAAVGPGTITLSQPASASGTAVALSVAEGPGNVAVNERQTVEIDGSSTLSFFTPQPSNATATTATIPFGASAPEVQSALAALPNVGAGNVKVSGPVEGALTVEFTGPRFEDTNVALLSGSGGIGKAIIAPRNGHSTAEICTAAIAASCAAGVEGSGAGQFAKQVLRIAVGGGGTLYAVDCVPSEGACEQRLQKFEPSGTFVEEQVLPQSQSSPSDLTADSSGAFYLASGGTVRKYDAAANLLETIPGHELSVLGIDEADDLLGVERESSRRVIVAYDAAGTLLRRFGYGTFSAALSGWAGGGVLTAENDSVIQRDLPPPGPVLVAEPCKANPLGNTKATLRAEVNPEGKATAYRFQYVEEESFKTEGGWSSPKTKSTPESASVGSDFSLHEASAEITGLVPETTYRCRAIAANEDNEAGIAGPEGTFETLPPLEITATWSSEVGTEAATLNATINPLGIPTSAHFQYVDEATYLKDLSEAGEGHGFDHAKRAPEGEEIELGAGESSKAVAVQIGGLDPDTSYRYRVVATDTLIKAKGKEVPGPTETLHTSRPGVGGLPEGRAYELVSPGQKNSAEVGVPGGKGGVAGDGYVAIQAASPSGEALTYTSWTSFGDAKSAAGTSQYLSRRTEAGWQTENISPFGFNVNPLNPPFVGFTPDLGFGAVTVSEPPCAEGAAAGFQSLCWRDNESGLLQPLTTETPQTSPAQFCTGFAGASADASKAIFAASGTFAGAPKGAGFNLYEWSAGEGLSLVSVLPNGQPAKPSGGTGFGPGGAACKVGTKVLRHAISADGQRVFWTYAPSGSEAETQLLARVNGTETIQLDAAQGAAPGPAGKGHFLNASADGSKVLFTAPGRLSADAGEGGDLYRYDFEAPPGERLTDLTPAALTPGAEAAAVQGLLGASEDGSHAYFVAQGVLTGEEENGAGDKAQAGADNLYLSREGAPLRFIATLAGEDEADWSAAPTSQTARVSPDGRHLAFESIEGLSGYDNLIEGGTHCKLERADLGEGVFLGGDPQCAEAFLYDAEADQLLCASCNPSGQRPLGPAVLPTWSNPYEQPHFLSDDGSRLFFASLDNLDPLNDTDGNLDVYEFELPGAGSCTAQSPTFSQVSGGCLFLISSGKSEDHSYLLDASASGRDVFFSSRARLSGPDTNENYDVYDARAGGGFPEPEEAPICAAEACKPPPASAPALPGPATPHFEGPGNPKPHKHRRPRKHGKHRRHAHKRTTHKPRRPR